MDHLLALRAFVRIAEAGSFAKAADSMNLPRSSVSKLLRDLEAHLDTKLVERTTRAVMVTHEGAAYRERAARVLAEIDEMDSTLAGGRIAPKGRLRVDVGSSLANVLIIPALSSFHAAYPEIDLQLGISDRPVDLIGEGVDCVLRTGPLPDNTSLVARKLCELDWVTCAAPTYLEGRELPHRPADLEGHSIVTYFSAETGRPMPLRYIENGEPMEIAGRSGLSVNESTAHITALRAGLGIGQTFGFMMRQESDALVELLADFKPKRHVLNLVYPASRFPNRKLRAFSDWIAGVCAAHGRRAESASARIVADHQDKADATTP